MCKSKKRRHVLCLREWQKAARFGSLWPSAATYRDENGAATRNPLCSQYKVPLSLGENNTMKCAIAILKLMLLLYLGLTVIGCANYRMIDFTVISSKDTQLKIDTEAKGSRVEGTDARWSFVFNFKRPDLKEAVDRAIEKVEFKISLRKLSN